MRIAFSGELAFEIIPFLFDDGQFSYHCKTSIELLEIEKAEGNKLQSEVKKLHKASSAFDTLNISKIADTVNNCSKVVDENGEPMVVYHGTNGSFNEHQFGRKSKRYYLLSDVDVESKFDDGQFSYHCKTYYDGEKKHNAVAVVEFGNFKKSTLLNGYKGGVYNISVTTYDPDSLDKYLNKKGHLIIYDKQKNGESRSNSSSSVLSLSNDSPFTLSITESAESGKSNDEIPESPQINYSV